MNTSINGNIRTLANVSYNPCISIGIPIAKTYTIGKTKCRVEEKRNVVD